MFYFGAQLMAKEITVRVRVPESMSARQAAVFVRNALNREWETNHPSPTPRWNITVYQKFDTGSTYPEYHKVRS